MFKAGVIPCFSLCIHAVHFPYLFVQWTFYITQELTRRKGKIRIFRRSIRLFVLFGLLRDHRFRNLLVRFMSEDLVHIIRAGSRSQSDSIHQISTRSCPPNPDSTTGLDFNFILNFSCSSIIVRTIRETLITISKLLQK